MSELTKHYPHTVRVRMFNGADVCPVLPYDRPPGKAQKAFLLSIRPRFKRLRAEYNQAACPCGQAAWGMVMGQPFTCR